MAVLRRAVRIGIPIASLNSLEALLDPAVVEQIIEAYWQKDGEEPKVFTIDLGCKLLSIARATGCLDASALAGSMTSAPLLEEHRRGGMTEKNLKVIRQVLTEGVWQEVLNLPQALMAQARIERPYAPVKAAVKAQIAVAIAILTVTPVRLGNLIRIQLDQNLIKPGGPHTPYWLVFPDYDVKNRVKLEFKLPPSLTELIDEYVHDFRTTLLRGSNELYLFPGENGGFKQPSMFSAQVSQRIEKATGLCITVHQFRHAAAAIFLKHRPGHYETVRLILGHRNIQTTINFYCELQTIQATETFAGLIREEMGAQ